MSRFRKPARGAPAVALASRPTTPFPASVPLPVDFQPDGIATGPKDTFYVGSLTSGDIYRGSLRTGAGQIFIHAPPGRAAVGMRVGRSAKRLWVAGGATGHAFVYSTNGGSTVADLTLTRTTNTLINDVTVTGNAAYFTDTFKPVVYKIPIGPRGWIGAPRTVRLSGPAAVMDDSPNLNGIDATRDGRRLILAHSSRATLYLVDPATGASRAIDITGGELTAGAPGGILLDGRTLWVVENFANRLVRVKLSRDLTRGRITEVVTDDLFRMPTTIAEDGHRLALVNGRRDLGTPPPFGPGAPPGTDFDVVQLGKS